MATNDLEILQKLQKYNCLLCQYITDNKTNYEKHLMTAKHKTVEKSLKKSFSGVHYECICCQFITDNKTKYETHLLTTKHLTKQKALQEKEEQEKSKNQAQKEEELKEFKENMMNALMQKDDIMKQLFLKMSETQEILIQQNKETQDKLLETQDKLIDLVKEGKWMTTLKSITFAIKPFKYWTNEAF